MNEKNSTRIFGTINQSARSVVKTQAGRILCVNADGSVSVNGK